ncbi:hypothetical protein K0U91_11860 [Chryseobacterium chendengshani]|uniref:hypothetical protein n=1 Tax=Chryseobacterium sp. LJ668 TaxID=2864040 RepID=UPI001C694292|nr:hypothetical protein [Chryseobacterium sp. LJ668]MBW8523467.1 hypothetical protein [Chryseobacterium sp. LJ668]QYK15753.1 hypothetical protein K0U91_11860 [Chryseobacterium sp. LJ668]
MIKKIILCALLLPILSLAHVIDNKVSYSVEKITKKRDQNSQEKIPKTVIIKTKKFKIKIDRQPNGNYLYQSWGANTKITSKPSMIVSDGEVVPDGSGGNYYFEFNNNGTFYQVWRNYLTNSSKKAPYTLVVIGENGETLVRQDAQIVKN